MIDIDQDSIRHLKFVDGNEVICEILEDSEDEFVVRYAFQIYKSTVSEGVAYYLFKHWMMFQESSTDLISVNANHITAIAAPKRDIKEQYFLALKSVLEPSSEEAEEDYYIDIGDQDSNQPTFIDKRKLH